MNTVQLYPQAQ